MHPVAIFDLISLFASLAAIVILLKSGYRALKWDVKLMIISLLVFTLVYNLCLALEWGRINIGLDPYEDIIGALLPMWWAFILYAFLQQIAFTDLHQSEHRFRRLFEQSNDAVIIHESNHLIDANQKACRLLGYKKEQLLGTTIDNIFGEENSEESRKKIETVQQGVPLVFETEFKKAHGSRVDVEVSSSIVDPEKRIIQSIVRDITERKQSARAVQASEKRAKRLAEENAVIAKIGRIINSSLEIDEVYERFAQEVQKLISFDRISINLINYQDQTTTISYVIGIDLPGRLRGDTVSLAGSLTEETVTTRNSFLIQEEDSTTYSDRLPLLSPSFQIGFRSLMSIPLILKDTVIGVLQLSSFKPHIYSENERHLAELVGDQIASAIANAQLFAEHLQSSEALQESEERYRDLVENSVTGFYQVEENGKFLLTNQRLAEMLGYDSSREFMADNENITPLYVHPETRPKILEEINEKGFVQGREVEFKTKDEKIIWVKISTRIKTDKAGAVIYDGIIEDITERKQLETQLQHAQRMESIGTLAGGIAHDFNNLLMAVQGNVSLILAHSNITHPHYDKVKSIEKLVKSGAKLTGQLLGYARKGKYEAKPINFNQIVEETANTFASARKEIQIHKALSEDLFAIEADKGQIEQVLLNLYLNAADAMEGGGELFIATTNTSDTEMQKKTYDPKPGSYVMLKVTDSGVGMDKETMEHIFEPFFTTKKMGRGTGLGLASAYGIIKAHGGYIDVESEMRRGTTFYICLPALEIKVEREVERSQKIIKGNETVLFVDDEQTVLGVGRAMLKYIGYSVFEATGGREALEIYKNNKNQIVLVVLDMIMPDMGGSDTYDRLKEINPGVKVLLSSGYSLDGQAEDILKRGCDGFIQKPFDLIELSRKIKEVLK